MASYLYETFHSLFNSVKNGGLSWEKFTKNIEEMCQDDINSYKEIISILVQILKTKIMDKQRKRKKHKCNICDSSFSTKTILISHIQKIHEGIKDIETDAEV